MRVRIDFIVFNLAFFLSLLTIIVHGAKSVFDAIVASRAKKEE